MGKHSPLGVIRGLERFKDKQVAISHVLRQTDFPKLSCEEDLTDQFIYVGNRFVIELFGEGTKREVARSLTHDELSSILRWLSVNRLHEEERSWPITKR